MIAVTGATSLDCEDSYVPVSLVGQGAGDGAEGIADLGPEQAHDGDHDDGDEREDDRVLDEALAFFLGCE